MKLVWTPTLPSSVGLQWWFCTGGGMRHHREELFGNPWPLSVGSNFLSSLPWDHWPPYSPNSHLWLWNSASHQIPPGCPFCSVAWKLSLGYKLKAITVLTTLVFPLKGIIILYDQLFNVQKQLFRIFFFFWLFSCLRQDGKFGPLLPLGQKQEFVRDFLAILCTLKTLPECCRERSKQTITWFWQVSRTCQRGSASALLGAAGSGWGVAHFSQLKKLFSLSVRDSPHARSPSIILILNNIFSGQPSLTHLGVKSAPWPVVWSPGSPCLPQSMKSSFAITCLSISLPL